MMASMRRVSPGRAEPRILTARSADSFIRGQVRIGRVFLRHHAGHLRAGFHQQHAGQNRFARQMAAQIILVAAHAVFAHAFLARRQAHHPVHEPEFRPVRQRFHGQLQNFRRGAHCYVSSGSTTV